MEESILISIKKLLNVDKDYKIFDPDIIIHINTAFVTLNELGVGPEDCFSIEDDIAVWSDFIGDKKTFNDVKTFIYLKVKLIFDPPLNSAILESYKQTVKELEWRLNVKAESK